MAFFQILPKDPENLLLYAFIYAEFAAFFAFTIFGYILGAYADRLENLAMMDKLTGLFNRHFMNDRLTELVNVNKRYGKYFSLVILDLDHFKKVNDVHGHVVGDQTLMLIASIVVKEVRSTDHPCRFGGEEFIILCPHTKLEEAYNLAERIRQKVCRLSESELGYSGPQTISAGVYFVSGDLNEISSKTVLENTDKALYEAKKQGRNRVVC